MTSKTPKTDAALIDNADLSEWGYGKSNYVDADFARQLEEENVAMKNAITTATELIDGLDLHLMGNYGMFVLSFRKENFNPSLNR